MQMGQSRSFDDLKVSSSGTNGSKDTGISKVSDILFLLHSTVLSFWPFSSVLCSRKQVSLLIQRCYTGPSPSLWKHEFCFCSAKTAIVASAEVREDL